jgi:hypothetical protein
MVARLLKNKKWEISCPMRVHGSQGLLPTSSAMKGAIILVSLLFSLLLVLLMYLALAGRGRQKQYIAGTCIVLEIPKTHRLIHETQVLLVRYP